MSADKYPSIFSRQIEAIVSMSHFSVHFPDLRSQPSVKQSRVISQLKVKISTNPLYVIFGYG